MAITNVWIVPAHRERQWLLRADQIVGVDFVSSSFVADPQNRERFIEVGQIRVLIQGDRGMSPVVVGYVPPSELVRLIRALPQAIAAASEKVGAVFLYLNSTSEWVEEDELPDGWPSMG